MGCNVTLPPREESFRGVESRSMEVDPHHAAWNNAMQAVRKLSEYKWRKRTEKMDNNVRIDQMERPIFADRLA